jgi:hypothetical protein
VLFCAQLHVHHEHQEIDAPAADGDEDMIVSSMNIGHSEQGTVSADREGIKLKSWLLWSVVCCSCPAVVVLLFCGE